MYKILWIDQGTEKISTVVLPNNGGERGPYGSLIDTISVINGILKIVPKLLVPPAGVNPYRKVPSEIKGPSG